MAGVDLVSQLRQRLNDERVGRIAFRLQCNDSNASECLIQLSSAGVLTTSVIRAREATSLTVDLTDPAFNTVRKLYEHLATKKGYVVQAERDMENERPAIDLRIVGSLSCLGIAVPFRHHIFSDQELENLLSQACRRHNVSYTPATVPPQEEEFVLMLAQAQANRTLASDAAKRAGMEFTVDQLLGLANSQEKAYNEDVKRQHRVLPVARPMDEATYDRGEVVTTQSYRRSNRTGWQAPISAALYPVAPILSAEEHHIEDVKVTLSWTRNRDNSFYAYELWRDTRPNIERPSDVQLVTDVPAVLHDSVKRPYTAKLVFRSTGPHSSRAGVGTIAILSEQGGQTVVGFTDTGFTVENPNGLGPATAPPLEPDTVYYYKLFVINLNDEVVGSNEVTVKTLLQRPLFSSSNPEPAAPTSGPAGTVVTLRGTGFTANMKCTVGGKVVTPTFVNSTTVTIVIPAFANPNALNLRHDIVIEHETNGLIDVLANGFLLTT